ncbi:amidase signature enzyme [Heliocybe sulcata]|uniref:amidase n=1 Tax=Heliocybe sulcata TaxID=5364 RepID=A0A5C3MR76_9AGAM|nr:amidase signature enzyme [Heliocybe sulcata]
MLFSYLAYLRACRTKQKERQAQVDGLPAAYHAPLSSDDAYIVDLPIAHLIEKVKSGELSAQEVLQSYGKKALQGHTATNCLTEIMIPDAETWAKQCNVDGPLAGVPVSLKDTLYVKGYDACIGYADWVGKRATEDAAIVKLLRDAGAVPFVKTNVPITLMSFESFSDVTGYTENPHVKGYTAGGSSGGEAALIAYGGSRVGIGSDGAGSLRVPAHYSGIYTIKPSVGRFPKTGDANNHPGQEATGSSYAPLTRSLADLETVWRAIVSMQPWKYDHHVIPIPWREVNLSETKVRFGVMWHDGIVTPSPACARALRTIVDTLQKHGYEVIPVNPPSPYEGFKIASQCVADSCKLSDHNIYTGESNDPGMTAAMKMYDLPRWLKQMYVWYLRYIRRDEIYAGLVEGWRSHTVYELYGLVTRREAYRKQWFQFWDDNNLDFLVTVPNPLPAVPHGGMKDAFTNCIYTFVFNMLDYSAGVIPVTHVDRDLDALPKTFRSHNIVEKGAYKHYDPDKMHGLPIGVQIVGRRMEEEKVLEGMKLVESLLRQDGKGYEMLKT